MAQVSKRYKALAAKVDRNKLYALDEALKLVKETERFQACLRIDPWLVAWPETAPKLTRWGYQVKAKPLNQKAFDEVRRFLADWTKRMDAAYVMVSIPPDFAFPARDATSQLIENALLPHCREFGLPFALMPA